MYTHCVDVYIELVLFNNISIDFLLIVYVQICRRRRIKKLRTILACLICGVVATYYAVAPNWAQIVIKALLAPLTVLIFDRYSIPKTVDGSGGANALDGSRTIKSRGRLLNVVKDYCTSLALFVIFTYLTGGLVFGLSYLFGVDIASYAVLGVCALAIVIVLIVARCLVYRANASKKRSCEVVLHMGNASIRMSALCDSGNTLTDSVSGLPILILSKDAENKLPECKIQGFVSVNTVSGEQSLPIVRIDEVDVDGKRYSAYGALARKNFDGVDAILQYSMF